ncbi:hypothetical protein [Pontibacter pamirensis]|uniref:hypothetical protein n=1 Tax=Pontibacter pamirensis TaxID=2562824 RepID=UPI001389C83E|nr:hypothetical protein [Pontibacter pamirensis]
MAGLNNRQEQFGRNKSGIYHADTMSTTIYLNYHGFGIWRHLMGNLKLQHFFEDISCLTHNLDYLLYHHRNPHWYENQCQYHNCPEKT